MRSLLLFGLLLIPWPLLAQSSIDDLSPNKLQLGRELPSLEAYMYLITGEEEIYSRYDWLKASVMKNIANGIREGIYAGNQYNLLSEIKASKTTLFFYQNALFKIRWDFDQEDYPELKEISAQLNDFLKQCYGDGEPENVGAFKMLIWQGEKHYLQIFEEEESIQIEFRNKATQKIVEDLSR